MEDIVLPDVVLSADLAQEVNFTLGESFNEGVKYGDTTDPKNTPPEDVINDFKNPFPSLKSLDLSKNLIAEEVCFYINNIAIL